MVNLILHSYLSNLVQIFLGQQYNLFTEDTTSSMIKCGKALFSCALRLSELVPITLKKKDQITKRTNLLIYYPCTWSIVRSCPLSSPVFSVLNLTVF